MKVLQRFSFLLIVLIMPLLLSTVTISQTKFYNTGNALYQFEDAGVETLHLITGTEIINGKGYYIKKVSAPWYPINYTQYFYERIEGDSLVYRITSGIDSVIFNFNWTPGTIKISDTTDNIVYIERIDSIKIEDTYLSDDTVYYVGMLYINLQTGDTNKIIIPEFYRYSKKIGQLEFGIWSNIGGVKIDGIRYGTVPPYPEEIIFSADSLYLDGNGGTMEYYLINNSEHRIIIDSLFLNQMFGYRITFKNNDTEFTFPIFVSFPSGFSDTLNFRIPAGDSLQIILSDFDPCPICQNITSLTYFTDSLSYLIHFDGSEPFTNYFFRKITPMSGLAELSDVDEMIYPSSVMLYQNYPNPFNPVTKIKYSIPASARVILKIYDVLGREVVTLINKELDPGVYEESFDAQFFPSGVYFYSLTAGNFKETRKMVLNK